MRPIIVGISSDERLEELFLEPRSALILSGEARWAWKHGIPARTVDVWQQQERVRARRVSLTFRVIPHSSEDDQLTSTRSTPSCAVKKL
jgi:hypothetical protein